MSGAPKTSLAAFKVTEAWLESTQLMLERAVAYFGADRELESIRVSDVRG